MTVPDKTSPKALMRKTVLARRDAMSAHHKASAENAIRTRLLSAVLARDGVISGFLPIRSEVNLTPVLTDLAKAGRTVVLPVVIDRDTLQFRRWTPGTALVDAGFGTVGPGAESPVLDPDIVITPFSAFDRTGARLGYGAGHYDRAFARLREAGPVCAMGAGFALQEVDSVPADPHDRPLDLVVTERETIMMATAA